MNWWKAIGVGYFMLEWFERASRDGKITQAELVEGVNGLIQQIGVEIEIDVAPPALAGGVPRKP